MQVRVRLGAGLRGPSGAAFLTVVLEDGATVADLYARLAATERDLRPVLPSTLPVLGGEQAGRDRVLRDGEQVALLMPMSGG